MKLLGRLALQSFGLKHPDSRSALRSWKQAIEANNYMNLVELKRSFSPVDYVKPYTVFNISGNKYRLIAIVDYELQTLSVEDVLTHSEYDKGRWR
ncbi:MAG: type II toxin-antitoxin system HigB family toxin [Elusimicrobiota bacterium]